MGAPLPLHHPAAPDGPPPRAELGEDFAGGAIRLAGFCGVALGWAPEVFWAATPAEVAAVVVALCPPGAGAGAAVDAATLARLREDFPDD